MCCQRRRDTSGSNEGGWKWIGEVSETESLLRTQKAR
jgi:hypothetical protein